MATKKLTKMLGEISTSPTATIPELAQFIAERTHCSAHVAEEAAEEIVKHYVFDASLPSNPLRVGVERRAVELAIVAREIVRNTA